MAENYKHLYEQTKKMLAMYQDELVPGFRQKIEELEQKSKWISVKDRLPEKDSKVLAVVKGKEHIRINFAHYAESKWWICRDYGFVEINVTHWMPLPEAPKGEH